MLFYLIIPQLGYTYFFPEHIQLSTNYYLGKYLVVLFAVGENGCCLISLATL